MQDLTTIFEASFYTEPLMILCALFAFMFGVTFRSKFRELRFMFLYAGSSILQLLSLYYAILWRPSVEFFIEHVTSNIFILIESTILFHFFNCIIVVQSLRRIIQVIFTIFVLYVILLWSFTNSFYYHPTRLYLPQAFCILSFCFLYFFQLFKLPPKLLLLNTPAFWVTIGCLFYFSCTIPLFFVGVLSPLPISYLSINYLCYSVLFLLITKSFLCRPAWVK